MKSKIADHAGMKTLLSLFARNPMSVFKKRPWAQVDLTRYPKVARVPTMLSEEEQQFYIWSTWKWMRGRGAVLDLGAFIGGSTARLALGHKMAKHDGKVHSFDRFTVSPDVKERILYAQDVPEFHGRDMLPMAQTYLTPWQDRITFHVGDILETDWIAQPVEIAAVDAAKTDRLTDFIADRFLRHMIPGASILIHQDFLHWSQPWLCAQMVGFGDAFAPVAYCAPDTVVFLLKRELTDADIAAAKVTDLSDTAMLDAIGAMQAQLSQWDLAPRFSAMVEGVKANPNQRVAWKMKRAE